MEQEKESAPAGGVPALRIFRVFLRLGITAFGGPAMIPYIRDTVVVKLRWVADADFRDGVAFCQSIPGATAMQTAAYAGFRAGGFLGAAAAYVGFGLPAFVLMVLFSAVYVRAYALDSVASVFMGLRVIVAAIMVNATLNFGQASLKNARDVVLALTVAAALGLGLHPMAAIVAAILAGVILYRGAATEPAREISTRSERGAIGHPLALPMLLVSAIAVIMATLFFADRKLFNLAAVMLRIDLFAFGGGFASVPLMFHEVVDARHWIDGRTFMDGIALGQVTPGPIVITATFAGYQVAGLPGAVAATCGIFAPSFVLLTASIHYLDRLQASSVFRRMLRGALVCFVGLLLSVTCRFAADAPWSLPAALLFALALAALRFRVDLLWVVLAGASISAILL